MNAFGFQSSWRTACSIEWHVVHAVAGIPLTGVTHTPVALRPSNKLKAIMAVWNDSSTVTLEECKELPALEVEHG
jgi:hypothetical protein